MKSVLFDSYDFARIIKNGNIYVDKTEMLYKLVSNGNGSRYFISRPRRFGKSLMISTLEAIFKGRRELFDGLAIAESGYDWESYPVIHLDMSAVLDDSIDEIKKNIVNQIRRLARDNGVEIDFEIYNSPSSSFGAFLDEMSRKFGDRLVVLIDEYDAPVNRLVERDSDPVAVSSLMHDFYMQLKVNDAHIRFLMMTGVSKFAKLSVFSGLNNVKDLTLESDVAGLLGYTVDEIKQYFSEHIRVMAKSIGETDDSVLKRLLEWYDGYSFSPYSEVKVTNPVSLASALEKMRFDAFWDETGHSTLIYKHLKNRMIVPAQLNDLEADKSELSFCNIADTQSPALLYQTGYLTIKKSLPDGRIKFGIPNKEVFDALNSGMLSFILKDKKSSVLNRLQIARSQLKSDPASVTTVLNETLVAAFDAIPYDWTLKNEPEARRMFLFYCSLMGAEILGEVHSSKGRADAVLDLQEAVFIFEFKYDHTAAAALKQAEDKNYAGPFENGQRPIYLVGVNYNSSVRNIDPPQCKKLELSADVLWMSSVSNVDVGSSGPTGSYVGDGTGDGALVSGAVDAPLSAEKSGCVIEE